MLEDKRRAYIVGGLWHTFEPNSLSWVCSCESSVILLPLGPLNNLISTTVSKMGRLLRTYSRTIDPASLRASTALLWETSDTSTSFTRRIQSLTLKEGKRHVGQACLKGQYYGYPTLRCREAEDKRFKNVYTWKECFKWKNSRNP